jgi:hypothetical protein
LSLKAAHPALAPYSTKFNELIALDFGARLHRLNEAAEAIDLKNAFQRPIRFGLAKPATKAKDYEWAIGGNVGEKDGVIATRPEGEEALHDLLNALVWLEFPESKACLNYLQVSEITQERALQGARKGRSRSPRRDQITLFDENGAVFLTQDPALAKLLLLKDWRGLFELNRSKLLESASLNVLGHGLLQKCLRPFKSMTARAIVLSLPLEVRQVELDHALAAQLTRTWPDWSKMPLPIAGWPKWSDQQDEAFYADRAVFRLPTDLG